MGISKVLLFLFIFLAIPLSYAQLGEVAGQPTITVPVGSSSTANIIILNSGGSPIPFRVILPQLNSVPHNVTPSVTASPMNGTLAPGSQQVIQITTYMPSNDVPGAKWVGILQVVETTPQQASGSGMGATITAGVAKIVTIVAAKPLFNIYLFVTEIIAIVVIIAVGISAYYLLVIRRRRMLTAERAKHIAAARAKLASAKRASVRKGGNARPKAKPKAKRAKARRGRSKRKRTGARARA